MGRGQSRPARPVVQSRPVRGVASTPGINATVERAFRRAPLGCPLTFVLAGAGIIAFSLAAAHGVHHGPKTIWGTVVGVLLLGVGAIVLPFGVKAALQRRRNVTVLRCPKCGLESRTAPKPFTVQRWNDVEYAFVVCSVCGTDFTVDRYARLE